MKNLAHSASFQSLENSAPSNRGIKHLGLGMSIVPDVAVADSIPNIIVRPLQPEIPCTLGLMERISKQNNPALDIVREALLELKTSV
jgi:DNA-binding transcriptional LysR family regulator